MSITQVPPLVLAKGILTFVPGLVAFSKRLRRKKTATVSARYCYSVWLRHLVMAHDRGLPTNPQVLVEFGPGSSIGTGLAALIAGGEEYFALDIVKSANTAGNLAVFDQLVELFRARADIPGAKEFPEVKPRLPTDRFPAHVLTAARLAQALDAPRLARLRKSVATAGSSGSCVRYLVPWYRATLDGRLADMVLSQAVLEHVDDLAHAYQKMYDCLKPGGVMSHVIDFRCHHTARSWNGHWTYSDITWTLIRGRRRYFLNRAPCSTHASLLRQTGFDVAFERPEPQLSTIGEKDLASSFRGRLTPADLVTSGLFLQAVKPLTTLDAAKAERSPAPRGATSQRDLGLNAGADRTGPGRPVGWGDGG